MGPVQAIRPERDPGEQGPARFQPAHCVLEQGEALVLQGDFLAGSSALVEAVEDGDDVHGLLGRHGRRSVIGDRLGEGHALVFAGQIQAIYLGDYEGGLAVLEEALDRWSESSDKIFALLRIAQIQGELGQFDAAWATIAQARTVTERVLFSLGHAGLRLVEAILHNAQGGPEHWQQALNLQAQVRQMVHQHSGVVLEAETVMIGFPPFEELT